MSTVESELECNVCKGVWSSNFANVRRNNGCPSCAGRERLTYEFVKSEVEERGAELISNEYINAKVILEIKCKCGEVMEKCFDHFKRYPSCKLCIRKDRIGKRGKYTIEEVAVSIEKMGGRLLSDHYINTKQKLDVLCLKCDNIFNPTYKSIRKAHWCPYCCRPGTVMQNKLFDIVKGLYDNHETIYNYTADWLGRQHIDVFIKDLGLAIEYDGAQHFKPVRFNGVSQEKAEANFKDQKERDARKNKKIAMAEEAKYFIRFSYKDEINVETVIMAITKTGLTVEQ